MRVRTHLIAMPCASPTAPSIQIAALKAHLDAAVHGRCDCRTYSAFFSILHRFKGRGFRSFFNRYVDDYREHLYLPLYLRRFGPPEYRRRAPMHALLEAVRLPGAPPLSVSILDGLERATRGYLDEQVGRRLIANAVNLVGFTLNYHQVYASLYAAEHLRQRFPDRNLLFVYGGCSASLPLIYQTLVDLGIRGAVVVGEGERKLELLVRALLDLRASRAGSVLDAVAGLHPGVIVIGEKVDLRSLTAAHHGNQVEKLADLALPDYDGYFAALREACADQDAYAAYCATTEVLVEGSRGCFSRCDFCALNRSWQGFRRRSSDEVMDTTLTLTRKYPTSQVTFVDNVCDTWAEQYAEALIRNGIRQQLTMELRANHPEQFWARLALAGLAAVQVGVEAISSPLLKAMGKGTKAIHNLAAHKYLSELQVLPSNNLITHHPASTLADVRETRRILSLIPHWAPFRACPFLLMDGSPLYRTLTDEERARLRPLREVRLPSPAARYAISYAYRTPAVLGPERAVRQAWDTFAREYTRDPAWRPDEQARLDVVRVDPETIRITDRRSETTRFYEFSGDVARVYDACHAGLTLEGVHCATGLPPDAVKPVLDTFARLKILVRVDDHYLSLALRPRDELLARIPN